jgi:hypothetical protein
MARKNVRDLVLAGFGVSLASAAVIGVSSASFAASYENACLEAGCAIELGGILWEGVCAPNPASGDVVPCGCLADTIIGLRFEENWGCMDWGPGI